ncbi:Potassium channel KOR1 [Platanthera guangdongensis]|uniref:Potassium channel KOR1 n=1 Tax=Platanthera guangdongensis TaxID=2320717 RepID=A0ABR2M616_9ASPA
MRFHGKSLHFISELVSLQASANRHSSFVSRLPRHESLEHNARSREIYEFWTHFILLWAVYSTFFTPLEFGFFRGLPRELLFLDIISQTAFLADIVCLLLLAYRDPRTYRIVYSPTSIALRYFRSGFIFDSLSCLPWDLIYKACGRKEEVRYLLWIRLCRVRKVTGFFHKMEKDIRINYLFIRIVKLIVVELYCTHTAACTFYYLATTIPQSEEHYTWIGSLNLGEYSFQNFREIDFWRRYLTSLYFAIVTMATVGMLQTWTTFFDLKGVVNIRSKYHDDECHNFCAFNLMPSLESSIYALKRSFSNNSMCDLDIAQNILSYCGKKTSTTLLRGTSHVVGQIIRCKACQVLLEAHVVSINDNLRKNQDHSAEMPHLKEEEGSPMPAEEGGVGEGFRMRIGQRLGQREAVGLASSRAALEKLGRRDFSFLPWK